MTSPSSKVVQYLRDLHQNEPNTLPNDEILMRFIEIGSWGAVVQRLREIRDSETPRQRLGHFRQMMSHIEPSCIAEKILTDIAVVFTAAKMEDELIQSLS
jgi:hypothetical protein